VQGFGKSTQLFFILIRAFDSYLDGLFFAGKQFFHVHPRFDLHGELHVIVAIVEFDGTQIETAQFGHFVVFQNAFGWWPDDDERDYIAAERVVGGVVHAGAFAADAHGHVAQPTTDIWYESRAA
jgi:hypothetical protein